jgi:hypothetical protein
VPKIIKEWAIGDRQKNMFTVQRLEKHKNVYHRGEAQRAQRKKGGRVGEEGVAGA